MKGKYAKCGSRIYNIGLKKIVKVVKSGHLSAIMLTRIMAILSPISVMDVYYLLQCSNLVANQSPKNVMSLLLPLSTPT